MPSVLRWALALAFYAARPIVLGSLRGQLGRLPQLKLLPPDTLAVILDRARDSNWLLS